MLHSQLTDLLRSELIKPLDALGVGAALRIDETGGLKPSVSDLNGRELRRGFRWRFAEMSHVFAGSRQSGKGGFLQGLVELLDQAVLAPRQPGSLVDQFA